MEQEYLTPPVPVQDDLCFCHIVNDQANDPVLTSPARLKVAIITPEGED